MTYTNAEKVKRYRDRQKVIRILDELASGLNGDSSPPSDLSLAVRKEMATVFREIANRLDPEKEEVDEL